MKYLKIIVVAFVLSMAVALVTWNRTDATTTRPGYLVAQLVIHDRTEYRIYEAGFTPVLEQYGGKLVAVSEAVETVEGNWPYTRTVILEFPSIEQANTWYHSPEYQAIVLHRHASSQANIALFEGR